MLEFQCNRHANDGTPIIKDAEIAEYAERLIRDYNARYLEEPWNLDPLKFSEFYLEATLDFVDIYCEEGEQIAGATIFNREKIRLFDKENLRTRCEIYDANTILIDNGTMKEGRETFARFTVLHEDGHLCMHPSVFRNCPGQMNIFDIVRSEEPRNVICCRKVNVEEYGSKLVTQEDFREHQANVFAAAVAMPKRIFIKIATDAIKKMGCSEGYYVLPTLRGSDYDACADSLVTYMGQKFNVSKSAARLQLRKYRLIRTSWEEYELNKQRRFA